MKLSVAICTYQRLEPLRETLESLAACTPPGVEWELLVVDNGCDERVRELVAGSGVPAPVRYVEEPTLGTSHARNRAVREACAPVILFTDDDVTFDPGWLVKIAEAIEEHCDCDFWGGRVEPVWDQPKPAWFDEHVCPMLGDTIVQYRQGRTDRYWDPEKDPPFYTANLALRVKRVAAAGYFDTSVGHRGGSRMGMEDSLMVRAISKGGGRGWYAASAVVYHPVTDDRVTKKYARQFAWRQGWLSVQITRREQSSEVGCVGRVPMWYYRAATEQAFKGLGGMARGAVQSDSGAAFGGQVHSVFAASKLWHSLFSRRQSGDGAE